MQTLIISPKELNILKENIKNLKKFPKVAKRLEFKLKQHG